MRLPLALPPVVAAKGELLKAGSPVDGCEVDVEEEAFKTEAKGLPASCRRSSEALLFEFEAEGAAALPGGGPETPNKSSMLGVPSETAGSETSANGFVALCFS